VKSNEEVDATQVRFFTRHRWQLVTGGVPDKTRRMQVPPFLWQSVHPW
jgi:hypothetical protein